MSKASIEELEFSIGWLKDYFQRTLFETNLIDHKFVSQRRLCFMALIDGLSGFCFPKLKNKERFIKFLNEVAKWEAGNLVSFIQLRAWVKTQKYIISPELCLYLDKEYSKLIPADIIGKFGDCELFHRFTQSALLYKYRNALVHEAQLKTGTFPIIDTSEPYYVSCFGPRTDTSGNPVADWILYYPESFLENLCKTSIDACMNYMRENSIDPCKPENNPEYWS